jgi:hypothetical protein
MSRIPKQFFVFQKQLVVTPYSGWMLELLNLLKEVLWQEGREEEDR